MKTPFDTILDWLERPFMNPKIKEVSTKEALARDILVTLDEAGYVIQSKSIPASTN